MSRFRLALVALGGVLAMASAAQSQVRPYIGFVYPAGGQQGATFRIRLGGQGLDDVNQAKVSGAGVQATVVEYQRRLNAQEITLLREQLAELKRPSPGSAANDPATLERMAKLDSRIAEFVVTPACPSISNLVIVEVSIAPDAKPGARELILATPRGMSNPLVFHVGQLPETTRKPMITATLQVLGKEELALRKRVDGDAEDRITLPCTVNGQIASGEVNRYRFEARKGQHLVFSAQSRQLIPYIADAVPGWFQPVMALYDVHGKECAYCDDYRFNPDPTILFEVPRDGQYVLAIYDALYRGREDFVYRIAMGELPFVTSIFPLGGPRDDPVKIKMKGWNLQGAEVILPGPDAKTETYPVAASQGGVISNRLPFARDVLPECLEREPNNDAADAQKVTLPVIINGRINRPDDWDVFQFTGHAGDWVVAEVTARRLDSPLDSLLKLTDATGKLLALNDDHEDATSGINTHDADSYFMVKLPADGTYYVYLGDVARHGGEEYGYRLRISAPQPDFSLIVAPSSVAMRSKSSGAVTVHALRKDGFDRAILLRVTADSPDFFSTPTSLSPAQTEVKLAVRTKLVETERPVDLFVEGYARIGGRAVIHRAIPAEDRMQAFLWRHLVPADALKAMVFNPSTEPPPKRVRSLPAPSAVEKKPPIVPVDATAGKPKFTKQQVAGRLRQLKLLFEEGLLTEDFYDRRVAECEASQ